jgi:elongation factor P
MPKANQLKQGSVVEIKEEPYIVKKIEVRNPSSRGASTLYKVRFAHMKTKQKLDVSFKGDDILKEADCIKVNAQFSYKDGDEYVFMNLEDFDQYTLNSEDLGDVALYLTEGMEGLIILLMDGSPLAVEIPTTIVLEVIQTAPAMKGSSATSRTKPAVLSTGLEVQVPEYIAIGEIIKVNSETGKFMSRA